METAHFHATETEQDMLFDLELRLPPLPRTLGEVSQLLSDHTDSPDLNRLIEIVHADPLVATAVLRRINSAYYGMRKKYEDIGKAIYLIGFLEVCNLTMAVSYRDFKKTIAEKEHEDILNRIMRVSVGAGFLAHQIAEHLKLPKLSSAFTSGLMHNVGRMILFYNNVDAYVEANAAATDAYLPSLDAERGLFGMDHAALGSLAIEHWQLPESLGALIEHYPMPGHLDDSDHRTIGIAMAISVEVVTQLCHHTEMNPSWAAGMGEDEEAPPPDIEIHYSTLINQLARGAGKGVDELKDFILHKLVDTHRYIENMMVQD